MTAGMNALAGGPGLQQSSFTVLQDDVPVHFQILTLPKQIYVWVACGAPKLATLSAAVPGRQSSDPAATALLGWSANSGEQALAAKLSRHTGRAVLLSLNLPAQGALAAAVECELRQRLPRAAA